MTPTEKKQWVHETFEKPQPKSTLVMAILIPTIFIGMAIASAFHPEIIDPPMDKKWPPIIRSVFLGSMVILSTCIFIQKLRASEQRSPV